MNSIFIGIAVTVVVLLAISRIGYKRIRQAEKMIVAATDLIKIQNQDAEIVSQVIYHGGLPEFPKPAVLYLALDKEKVIFCDQQSIKSRVCFENCIALDEFTICQKASKWSKSVMTMGPFISLLFKDKVRYFVVIKYIDSDQEENHILLESADKRTQEKVWDEIDVNGKNGRRKWDPKQMEMLRSGKF